MSENYEIAVLGAGAWGTALAVLIANTGKKIALWARSGQAAATMQTARANPRLPDIDLPANLTVMNTYPRASVFLICVPMQFARVTLSALPPDASPLVLCCKGLEQSTLLLPPELAAATQVGRPVAVLTGPNFANEIAYGLPAAAVLAAENPTLRAALMAALHSPTLRLYGSADIMGAALGGAAKNVIAIAAGAVIGAGLGENARAALITRGIAEIARLSGALGGRPETISGLSGLGDLLLTCTSANSRNYALGVALGKGERLPEILSARTSVTEGVATAPALHARARQAGVDMPIIGAVANLLAGNMDIQQTMVALMSRSQKDE